MEGSVSIGFPEYGAVDTITKLVSLGIIANGAIHREGINHVIFDFSEGLIFHSETVLAGSEEKRGKDKEDNAAGRMKLQESV